MSGSSLFGIAVVLALLVLATAAPASAQQPGGERPYGGVFRGGTNDAGQLLSAGLSIGGGYNSAVSSLVGPVTSGNSFGQVGGNLDYAWTRGRGGVRAGASSNGQYYSGAPQQFPAYHVVNLGSHVDLPMSTRTSFSLAHSLSYQPLHTTSPFPGLADEGLGLSQPLPLDPQLAASADGFASYDSRAALTHMLTRRTGSEFHVGFARNGLLSSVGGDLTALSGGASLSRSLVRGLDVRLGYTYTQGRFSDLGQTSRFHHQNIDAGLNFNRQLSLSLSSRRTTVSFATGSAIVTDRFQREFRVTGHALLNHDIGRSWRASAAYSRHVAFRGTVRAPEFADSVSAGVGGLLGPRVDVRSVVGLAIGKIGLGQGTSFKGYYGTTSVTFGLTRYLGADVSYAYYRSDFDNAAVLTPGMSDFLDRQSVRASLRVWAPLIQRARSLNATR